MPRQKKQHLKRRADGRYRCRYDGKDFYGQTEDEALAARDAYIEAEKAGRLPDQRNLFSYYADKWVKAFKAHLTKAPYNQHIRIINTFLEVVGDKSMHEYTPTDISLFYQHYNKYSASQIHDVRDTIRGIFRAAVADGTIDRDPTLSIKPPKGTKGSHRAITPDERLIIHQLQHKMRPAVMIMLYAGLRRGEALAIDIKRDIDFKLHTITVHQAVRFVQNGKPELVDPKTEAGTRVIPMLGILEDELKSCSGLLCAGKNGKLMTESAWSRGWESYCTQYEKILNNFPSGKRWYGKTKETQGKELPPWKSANIRPHDMRHSYCTMLYDLGIDLKTAMLWMGHKDQSMILRIYAHLTEQRQELAKKALENAEKMLFGGQNEGQISEQSAEPLKLNDDSD